MHLTRLLFKKIAPGKIWTGKNRVLKPVKFADKIDLYRRLATEEEAMFYLSRPYLTKDQESAVAKELEPKKIFKSKKNMLPNKYTTDMLLHLRTSESWE